MFYLKIAGWLSNSVDPDEMPHSAASHQGLHCLLRPVCLNIYSKDSRLLFRREANNLTVIFTEGISIHVKLLFLPLSVVISKSCFYEMPEKQHIQKLCYTLGLYTGWPRTLENREKRKKVKKNSLQGKIREFEILLKIREKSGNFKKSYFCKVKIFKFYSCHIFYQFWFWLPWK